MKTERKEVNQQVQFETTYLLKPAGNSDEKNPLLYAEVQHLPMVVNGKPSTKGGNELHVFKSPEDFGRECMSSIVHQINDELLERELMKSMRITIKLEYLQEHGDFAV